MCVCLCLCVCVDLRPVRITEVDCRLEIMECRFCESYVAADKGKACYVTNYKTFNVEIIEDMFTLSTSGAQLSWRCFVFVCLVGFFGREEEGVNSCVTFCTNAYVTMH